MKLSYDAFAAHLEKQLLPAYLISGDEPLLTGEAADAVRARARATGFAEREVHFLERGADWEAVRASAQSLSLFSARRIVEIRLPSGKPGTTGGAALASMVEAADPDTLILILTGRLDRDAQNAAWVRAVVARGAWLEVWPMEPRRLVAWLETRCRRLGLEPEREALEILARHTEGNLLAAHQELEKLALLAPGGRVTAEAVLSSVADSTRFDVSQLGLALLEGDGARALRVLAGLRAEGVEPTLVVWAAVTAVRSAWAARSGQMHHAAPAWARQPQALEKVRRRAARLSFASLVSRAERADRMAKGRLNGDPWDELALLAAEACGTPALPALDSMVK